MKRIYDLRPDDEIGWVVIMLAVLSILPVFFLESTFWVRIFDRFLILALIAIGINIAFGHTDQLFLFMGGLAGVGAYTTAVLAQDVFGVTPWLMIPAGILMAGLFGGLVSWISARRKLGVILISILTLNLQLALQEAFVGARFITGGSEGYRFEGLNLGFNGVGGMLGVNRFVIHYYLLLVFLALAMLFYMKLIRSNYGLAFEAIREDDLAATSIGIDVVRVKTVAGFIGAAIIGLAGVMMAELQGVILPGDYTFLSIDVMVLIILIVGGLRTTFGPVVGAGIILVIEESLNVAVEWQAAIFGALLIILFLYFRRGFMPFIADLDNYIEDRFASSDTEARDRGMG